MSQGLRALGRVWVVIGPGNLGRLFAGGALRCGWTVVPVRRDDDVAAVVRATPEGSPLLVATGEAGRAEVMASLPQERRGDAIWVQNGLRPRDWNAEPDHVTVASVWTNCKPGAPLLVGRRTGVWGRWADAMVAVHDALGMPACALSGPEALVEEIASKDAFIVTINALGLAHDRPLGAWVDADPERVEALLRDAAKLASARAEGAAAPPNPDRLLAGAREAIDAMSALGTRGRSAPKRIRRALADADTLGLEVPALAALRELAAEG